MHMRLKHIVRDRDRHGNVRAYFRRRGQDKVRIREQIGSAEFFAIYHQLLAKSEVGRPAKAVPVGSLRWLCLEYFKSSAFRQLDERTQHVRRLIFEAIWAEPTRPGSDLTFGAVAYMHINAKAVRVLRDRKLDAPEISNRCTKIARVRFRKAKRRACVSQVAQDCPFGIKS